MATSSYRPTVILLNGPPGSGKTTLARTLAATLSRPGRPFLAVHTAEFQQVAPLHLPQQGRAIDQDAIWTPQALAAYSRAIPRAVFQFAAQGLNVIVDGTWPLPPDAYEARKDALAVYSYFPVVNVGIECDLPTLLARRDERVRQGQQPYGDDLVQYWAEAVHRGMAYDVVVDSGAATVEDSAGQIAAGLRP